MSKIFQLAPLHGVTNRHFRAAWFSHFGGFDSAMTPFILAVPGSSVRKNHFKDVTPFPEGSPPLIPQILGNESASFIDSARVLQNAGYGEVNWNLGCPYPMVAKKYRGSGLLPHPDRIDRFLESVFRAESLPAVSVKLRLGRSDLDEWKAFMPVLNRYPLASVTIHGRVGTQMYRGSVHLAEYAEAAAACSHPVIGNGDIFDLASFKAARAAFPGAAGWMLGRGALYDPYLPARIRAFLETEAATGAPDAAGAGQPGVVRSEKAAICEMFPAPGSPDWLAGIAPFHDDLFDRYRSVLFGPAHVLDKMKEIWTYLAYWLSDGKRDLAKLARVKGFDDYQKCVDGIFCR